MSRDAAEQLASLVLHRIVQPVASAGLAVDTGLAFIERGDIPAAQARFESAAETLVEAQETIRGFANFLVGTQHNDEVFDIEALVLGIFPQAVMHGGGACRGDSRMLTTALAAFSSHIHGFSDKIEAKIDTKNENFVINVFGSAELASHARSWKPVFSLVGARMVIINRRYTSVVRFYIHLNNHDPAAHK